MKHYSQEQKQQFVARVQELVKGGKDVPMACLEAGIAPGRYYAWRKVNLSGANTPTKRQFTPEQRTALVSQVREQIAGGKTLKESCREAGIHETMYRSWAKIGHYATGRAKKADHSDNHQLPFTLCPSCTLNLLKWLVVQS